MSYTHFSFWPYRNHSTGVRHENIDHFSVGNTFVWQIDVPCVEHGLYLVLGVPGGVLCSFIVLDIFFKLFWNLTSVVFIIHTDLFSTKALNRNCFRVPMEDDCKCFQWLMFSVLSHVLKNKNITCAQLSCADRMRSTIWCCAMCDRCAGPGAQGLVFSQSVWCAR